MATTVPVFMRFVSAILLLLLAIGCAPVPKEVLRFRAEREISWSRIRVTARIVRSGTEVHVGVRFWVPGLAATALVDPFEGVHLTLQDGEIVESPSRIPEVIEWSGGSVNAWSEKIDLVFPVPVKARPTTLVLRCGLGVLECSIEEEETFFNCDAQDKY